MKEQDFEDILSKYPELIEEGLTFKGRQVRVRGKSVDLLFEDRHGQTLIVELKKGVIKREHTSQLLDYAGYFLSPDDPTVRVMLVGNRVPPNLRRSLDHHGFEWRDIEVSKLIEFLKEQGDEELLECLSDDEPLTRRRLIRDSPRSSPLRSEPKIFQKFLNVFKGRDGQEFSRSEIIDGILEEYPGTNRTSLIPSDYCYNITNQGIPFKQHIFEYLEHGRYRYLGQNYRYTGLIYWKGKVVGEWSGGKIIRDPTKNL